MYLLNTSKSESLWKICDNLVEVELKNKKIDHRDSFDQLSYKPYVLRAS